MLLGIITLCSCKIKQKAEARIKGEGGEIVLEVEVVSGAEFKTKGKIPPDRCQGSMEGALITVASCDVLADVTRKENGKEVTRREKHTLEYKVACIPGTEWEVDCSDPIIMQAPLDWKVAEATFSGNSLQGTMTVDETPPTADDYGTLYIAEPGYKLIVVGFPYGTPEDTYQIQLRFTYSQTGRHQVKAIFAAAVRITDPYTGEVRMFYPPAIPAVHDFHLVQDPLFIAEVTGAYVFARQMNEQEAAAQSLPETGTRSYFVLSTRGADPATVDPRLLSLRTD